ncbi:MAG: hypothetical protein ACREJC_17555 [Tepidisphaeraceae bacterium]
MTATKRLAFGVEQNRTVAVRLDRAPNWTAIGFFAALGTLHLIMATLAFTSRRWEGYMSLVLGCAFVLAAVLWYCSHSRIEIDSGSRRMRVTHGLGRFIFDRHISFADVHAVRLTMSRAPEYPVSRIEILCDNEDIECPPTSLPRQEALCLAMLMGVRLIKVSGD